MRVGILAGGRGWHVEDLTRAARTRGIDVTPLDFTRLGSTLDGIDDPRRFFAGGTDVGRLDAIIVRTMPAGTLEQIIFRMDWLQRVEADGVLVLNSPRALEAAIDKYLASARLAAAGLPVPPTISCERADDAERAFEALGRDVVMKPLFGSEGRGLVRLRDAATASSLFRELEERGSVFYLQRFIEHPGFDLRVLVLGGEPAWCMQRIGEDWATNVARGARAKPAQVTSELGDLAVRAARCLGAEVAGVDILRDTSGALWVLEVNAVPGWRALAAACDADVATAVLDYACCHARGRRR